MLCSVHIRFMIPYWWGAAVCTMSRTLEDPVVAALCARTRLLLWPWHIRGVLVLTAGSHLSNSPKQSHAVHHRVKPTLR